MAPMIPNSAIRGALAAALLLCAGTNAAAGGGAPPTAPTITAPVSAALATTAPTAVPNDCLATGDGYLRARVAGAIEARIDWPNSGTQCQGETKTDPAGVRLSFKRAAGGKPDLLFVFGLTGIRKGQPARATGANLTVIVQGTPRIFGTLGDSRCTVDSLSQRALPAPGWYRIEARGFCTQPAHAVRGPDALLVSTFEFAGPVNFAN